MIQNKAYVTLLSSEDYLPAILVLKASMAANNCQHPLVVMVTEWVSNNPRIISSLKKAGCIVEIVPAYQYTQSIQQQHQGKTVLNTASKINVFALKQYDKLVYIDSDVLVLQNIDDLFDYPDGSMMWWKEKNEAFSALFVIVPANHNFRYYLTLQNNFNEFDGGLLNNLWFHIRDSEAYRIPQNYIEFYAHMDENRFYSNEVKTVHFCNKIKPWKEQDKSSFYKDDPTFKLYCSYLKEIKQWL